LMDFVLIYGPPGVGKLTVATELSRLTGYKLFDNHVSINWAKEYFPFDSPAFWRLIGVFRSAVIEEAARERLDLIHTYVYAHDEDLPDLKPRFEAVEREGGRVCLVQLCCSQEELERRVGADSRVERGKLTAVERLRASQERYDMRTPIPGWDNLTIDNTALAPGEVAQRVVEHYVLHIVPSER